MRHHNYYVYIATNPGRTVLYNGVTNDLDRRLAEHFDDANRSQKTFAGKYQCHRLIYYEHYTDIRWAIRREKEIKGWVRRKKVALIAETNPTWRFLNDVEDQSSSDLP